MYAIIETGGKQYKVREGDTVDVELVGCEIGDTVELDQVLMVAGDDEIAAVGRPTVEGTLVRATVIDEVKGDKVVVFKYRPKNRYRRKTGHRQKFTRLRIDELVIPGIEAEFEEEIAEVIEETLATEEAPAIEVSTAEAAEPSEVITAKVEATTEPEIAEAVAVEETRKPEVAEEPTAQTEETEDEETAD